MVAQQNLHHSTPLGLNVYLNIGHKPHLLTLARYISKEIMFTCKCSATKRVLILPTAKPKTTQTETK